MSPDIQPFFLPSAVGRIFCVYYPPQSGKDVGQDVLFFPPFAEELNKSRRMIALQARALARNGVGVLIPDLYGTGDSEGGFGAARWELWQQDMASALNWLRDHGRGQVIFWGQRLGALLAMSMISSGEMMPAKIILWQPVAKGSLYLTQFLRLRLAADMLVGGETLTTDDLRQELQSGNSVEVAGYDLHPDLAARIEQLELASSEVPPELSVSWLEITAAMDKPMAYVSRQIIDHWQKAGRSIEAVTVAGEPFWSTPEITEVPGLIDATVQRVLT